VAVGENRGCEMIDLFPFFNELDLLEIRLNSLAPYVERFVLVEMPVTHSGKLKPLYFEENKARFKDFNITHLIAPPKKDTSWVLEHYQREYLMNGLLNVDEDEVVLLSDLDEIPDLGKYIDGQEGAFKQKLYYYYLNVFTGDSNWKGTIATRMKNISKLNRIRNLRNKYPTIVHGGWHFSTLGPVENIIYKIESFAHVELNTPEHKSRIEENRRTLTDPYNRVAKNWGERKDVKLMVETPNGPEWLLNNKERYPHLWI
jgi:hypothetical protein